MKNKKNENLSGSYTDEQVAIIGNNKKSKPRMRDLNTVPYHEVQDAVEKIKRKREKNILVREEMDRQARLEHPKLARAIPYLQVIGIIVGLAIFFTALWLILAVNSSYDNSVNPNLTQMILMRLVK